MTEPARDMKIVSFNNGSDAKPNKSIGESLKESKNAKRLEPANNMAREITPDMAKELQEQLYSKAIELGDEHKVYVAYVMESFDDRPIFQQDVTIKFSAAHPLGYDRYAVDLLQGRGTRFRFKPSYYGLLFLKGGVEHVIKGIDVDNTKNEANVIIGTPQGSVIAPAKSVYRWLKDKGVI